MAAVVYRLRAASAAQIYAADAQIVPPASAQYADLIAVIIRSLRNRETARRPQGGATIGR
ncbi:MAG TPA: hypothetical protein VKX28_00500 [Xanthobacteraceae bacterium]|nr:hypothetical protein [Xanthobacteraceae bacterium]